MFNNQLCVCVIVIVAFAGFCNINNLTMAVFRLLTWLHWAWSWGKMCKIIGPLAARAPAHNSSAVTWHRFLCALLVEAIQRFTQVQGEEIDSASWWGIGEVTVLEENMGWGVLLRPPLENPIYPNHQKQKIPRTAQKKVWCTQRLQRLGQWGGLSSTGRKWEGQRGEEFVK